MQKRTFLGVASRTSTEELAMSAVERTPVGVKAEILKPNVPDGLDRARHLVDVRHTSCCPPRCPVDRLHVHISAIEHGEAGIAPLECEEEVGPAEQNDLGALLPT